VTAALLDRGAPIFVEKPFATDPQEVRRLAAAGRGRVFVMYKWRYHPGIEALAALVRGGRLGRVTAIVSHRLGWGSKHDDVEPIWVLAPHDLSIVLHVLGDLPAPRWACVERNGEGTPCGLRAQLGEAPTAFIEVSSRHPRQDRSVVVSFEAGSALLADPYVDHIAVRYGSGVREEGAARTETLPIATEYPLLRELRCFVQHLSGGPPPLADIAEEPALIETLAALIAMGGAAAPEGLARRRA
jgi:predicted dehydrogenase